MPLPILIPTALPIFPTCADQLFIHLLTLPTTCLIPTYHSALILTTPFEHTHIIRPYPPHFWRNTDSIHFHTACIPQKVSAITQQGVTQTCPGVAIPAGVGLMQQQQQRCRL
ncbi:hypothetical protein F4825DRAFT_37 [Nemania diffusa]|nr:hypothetical protein F4825DRAFT_37 [Nemania diffusa]